MLKLRHSFLALAVFMTAGFILTGDAHANPVCETLEKCRTLRSYLQEQLVEQESQVVKEFLQFQLTQVDARIEELLTGDEKRTTSTGAVFTRDTSHAKLNEAWRDPDGLIWGDTVREKTDGTAHYMTHNDATNYCTSIGARLPTREEFIRLREYMGARSGTDEGYSHHDDKILPNLLRHSFWSSSSLNPDADDDVAYYFFKGNNGFIGYYYHYGDNAVRCVVGR